MPPMSASCGDVGRFLAGFADRRSRPPEDLEALSDHVASCPGCYLRLSEFFRTAPLPESSYLRETLDELAGSIYNLAKAIIRDRPPAGAEDSAENVRITEEFPGGVVENARSGVEMIEDAEDYVGSTRVGSLDLEEVRAQLENAGTAPGMKIDLALALFQRITGLDSRYTQKAWNWIGVLHYQKEDWDRAEEAFQRALAVHGGAREVRAFAHCNLAYVHKHRGDLDLAVRSARRSIVLAEEDDRDPYFGEVAEMYFRLLRGAAGDLEEAGRLLERILSRPGGRPRLVADLRAGPNAAMRRALVASPLRPQVPELEG
jgi:tetratricopeptide (TPR) repeat protein